MTFRRPNNVTHRILITVAIIFAVLAGVSAMAWLLPNGFNGLGDALVRLTGSADLRLNFTRIGVSPVPYMLVFTAFALFMRWLAGKW